jgi:dienelactone hydrolase
MRYTDGVPGTKIGFAYENSGHFAASACILRQAERDAAEVRAVAHDHQVTRAIGFSRGARAIVGALAEGPNLFERIALVIPPGGNAAGKYSTWLESLTSTGRGSLTADILVVGNRGDQGHPARVAEAWAEQLGAHLEILPSRAIYTDHERVMSLLAEFLC